MGAICLGIYAEEPPFPGRGGGRMFPRTPPPAPDLPTLLYQLGVGSTVWYAAALALPLMLWGAREVDVDRHGRRLVTVAAVAGLVVVIVGSSILQFFIVYRGAPTRPDLAGYLPIALRQNFLPWIALAGIVAAVEIRRRSLNAIVERERLRAQVAEQRLVALTGQLQPHFLFNTLQNISTLIHRDAEAADEMLAKLSDLLRELLRHRDQLVVTLRDELRCVRTYLEIAKLRFAERLAFEINAPPETLDAAVPLFILQPLVENALSHGIGGRARGGRITVTVSRDNGRLRMDVADDGVGLPSGSIVRDGIGLSNTRERLRASFGDDQHFALASGPDGGTVARIEIPWRV
jgi:signal transduction histidine kinase